MFKKYLLGSFFVITGATVLGLYLYNNILMKQQSCLRVAEVSSVPVTVQQLQQLTPMRIMNMAEEINSEYMLPKLMMDVTTCEYDDKTGKWTPVLTHTVYGDSREEMYDIIEAHQKTDAFFAASFKGEFEWNGGIIKLKNIVSDVIRTY